MLNQWARDLFGGSDEQSGSGKDPNSAGKNSAEDNLPPDGAFPCPPISPLVIDLDDDGIELISLENSDVRFDLDNNGFAEKTGWISTDDAFLALDVNQNGVIDNQSELFGNNDIQSNGFSKLSELDSNYDGVIDESDDKFEDLLLWQDLNSNGTSEENEIQNLVQVQLVSIDLGAIAVNEINQGNLVTDRSLVSWSDGSSSVIEDIWFQNSPEVSDFVLPGNFEYATQALFMPRLFGYGNLPSTLVSFSLSPELLASGTDLLSRLEIGEISAYLDGFEDFVFQWAGVDNIEVGSRGQYVDARKIAFLELAYGRDFTQNGGGNPGPFAGADLELQFDVLVNNFAARFMAESPSASLALGRIDVPTDHPLFSLSYFVSLRNQEFDNLHETGRFEFIFHELWDQVSNGSLELSDLAAIVELIRPDLERTQENFELDLRSAADNYSNDSFALAFVALVTQMEASGSDALIGNAEADHLVSTDGAVFWGREGNDTLNGGDGADTYVYSLGDGNDVIEDFSYRNVEDRLVFADVNAADAAFSRNAGKDLVITLSNGDTVTVTDHFRSALYDMEMIEFADGTVLDLDGIAAKLINDQNGAGDDLVLGSIGDDHFIGGEGNDTLNGGDGADTYVYSLGDGNDVIEDTSRQSVDDRLVFADVNATDVTFSQNAGKDLVIALSNGDTVTVTDHFQSGITDMEVIEFADGTVLDLTGIAAKSISDQNGAGDDLVLGSTGNDYFFGSAGNDTLKGGDGADTYAYSLGDGNDVIEDTSRQSVDDRLVFADVNATDVTFSQNAGKDLVIALSNGDTVTVTDHFQSWITDMEVIEFADGTVLDLTGIAAKSISDQNGAGDDLVLGSTGNDYFFGSAGNDTLKGGDGADTYVYSLGDGNDVIEDSSSQSVEDRFVFNDVNVEDVTFSQNAGKDLVITLSNGDTVTVTDHFQSWVTDMEVIEFADGTILDLAGIEAKANSDEAYALDYDVL